MRRPLDLVDPGYGLDVIGLGALNIDVITTRSSDEDNPVEDRETLASMREIEARRRAETATSEAFLGGSAFNAMVMLAQLHIDLRLGMVGISAAPGHGLSESHADRLRALHIVDLTRHSDQRPGLCLALSSPHGRQLRTAPEANLEIADYLADNDRLRTVVSSARILHLSSLLERPGDPAADDVSRSVADFVEIVKHDNPQLILSFDPGHTWVDALEHLPPLRRIYRLADVVYANAQEYAVLTRGADTRSSVHARSMRPLCPASTLIILKSLHEIVVQHAGGFDLARVPRRDGALAVDPTGAGDAVAAGVLAALGEGRSVVEGCELGLRIAAQRVSDFGDRGHTDLRAALGSVWRTPPSRVAGRGSVVADVGREERSVQVNVVLSAGTMTVLARDLSMMLDRLTTSDERIDPALWHAMQEAKAAADRRDQHGVAVWLRRLGRGGADLANKVSAGVVEQMVLKQLGL